MQRLIFSIFGHSLLIQLPWPYFLEKVSAVRVQLEYYSTEYSLCYDQNFGPLLTFCMLNISLVYTFRFSLLTDRARNPSSAVKICKDRSPIAKMRCVCVCVVAVNLALALIVLVVLEGGRLAEASTATSNNNPGENANVTCQDPASPIFSFPFCDPNLSISERAQDLLKVYIFSFPYLSISNCLLNYVIAILSICTAIIMPYHSVMYLQRLTAAEKIGQMNMQASAVPRLGMVEVNFGSEALHGVWSSCVNRSTANTEKELVCPTQFPSPLAMGASFDFDLWLDMADATSSEARALYVAQGKGLEGPLGLSFYAPNINLLRDPRWGRAEEVPSEDPMVNAKYGQAFVRGMQEGRGADGESSSGSYWKTVATCKHFAGYSLECVNASNPYEGCKSDSYFRDRHHFNAIISAREMSESYLPQFTLGCMNSGAIMCSYNAVNGVPMCGNKELLNGFLRNQPTSTGQVICLFFFTFRAAGCHSHCFYCITL